MSQRRMFWVAFEIQKRFKRENFPSDQFKLPKTSVEKYVKDTN
jgi:hypothetical protein